MKAEELIRDSLMELGVVAAEQPVSPDQMQTAIRYLNRLMYSYDYLGLGYAVVDSGSDNLTIPPYAEEWAVKALAVRMAKQFGPADDIMLLKDDERVAYRNMLAHIPLDIAQNYPGNLPVGSPNSNFFSGDFYPGSPDHLLNEQGDYILLEGDN